MAASQKTLPPIYTKIVTQYAFILGRKNLLSIAELCNVLNHQDTVVDIQRESLIAELKDPLVNPQKSLNQLGGIIKIAEVIGNVPKDANEIPPEVSAHLIKKFEGRTKKFIYGISAYSFTQRDENFLKQTLNKVKKNLKEANLKSRFINHNFKNLETAAIKGEKLLETGTEIIIIESKNKYYIAETKALQDFENYGERDYNRPARDPRLGMLPPKLAQIMINLSGLKKIGETQTPQNKTIYDPFTGVGTILTEGLLMGYNIVGSDIDSMIIQKAEKNINWMKSKYQNLPNQIHLFPQDATRLNQKDLEENPVDIVVTESYLGPPVSQVPLEENIQRTFDSIRGTIISFFKSIHPLIKTGTPVIISLLFYRGKDRFYFIENLIPKINQLGFEITPLIPQKLRKEFDLKSAPRESLLYDRPDQIVGREIWKFTKTR